MPNSQTTNDLGVQEMIDIIDDVVEKDDTDKSGRMLTVGTLRSIRKFLKDYKNGIAP
jgi:hypothetical protein